MRSGRLEGSGVGKQVCGLTAGIPVGMATPEEQGGRWVFLKEKVGCKNVPGWDGKTEPGHPDSLIGSFAIRFSTLCENFLSRFYATGNRKAEILHNML